MSGSRPAPAPSKELRDLVLWGATGQARVLLEFVEGLSHRVVAFVDRVEQLSPVRGVPVLREEQAFRFWLAQRGGAEYLDGAIAIGGQHGKDRRLLATLFADCGLSLPSFVHPTAFVARDTEIGAGSQILAMARVCAGASIGRSTIINTGASIDHDCRIEDGAHVAPGAILAGQVTVGRDAFIGTGAVILPRIVIGEGAIVGAGAVVTRPVPAFATMVGNPARSR